MAKRALLSERPSFIEGMEFRAFQHFVFHLIPSLKCSLLAWFLLTHLLYSHWQHAITALFSVGNWYYTSATHPVHEHPSHYES